MRIFYAGDQFPMQADFTDLEGNALNIAGCTVKFRYKIGSAAWQEKSATVLSTNPGRAEYMWGVGELVAGEVWWEWVVVDGSLRPITGPAPRRYGKVVAKS